MKYRSLTQMMFLLFIALVAAHESILMADIKTLTLTKGQLTTSRRVPPMQQLVCLGTKCAEWLQPNTVQCYNQGSDGSSIQWRCDAELDNSVKFGKIEVSCEGYSYKGDRNVLVGSCALEYQLIPVAAASTHYDQHTKDCVLTFFIACVVLIVFIVLVCICSQMASDTPVASSRYGGGGGGIVYRRSYGGGSWGGSSWGRSSGGSRSWSGGGGSRKSSGFGGSRSR